MKKYFFISYKIVIPKSTPHFDQEVIDKTPLDYVLYHRILGGSYSNRIILYSHEITKEEYDNAVCELGPE